MATLRYKALAPGAARADGGMNELTGVCAQATAAGCIGPPGLRNKPWPATGERRRLLRPSSLALRSRVFVRLLCQRGLQLVPYVPGAPALARPQASGPAAGGETGLKAINELPLLTDVGPCVISLSDRRQPVSAGGRQAVGGADWSGGHGVRRQGPPGSAPRHQRGRCCQACQYPLAADPAWLPRCAWSPSSVRSSCAAADARFRSGDFGTGERYRLRLQSMWLTQARRSDRTETPEGKGNRPGHGSGRPDR